MSSRFSLLFPVLFSSSSSSSSYTSRDQLPRVESEASRDIKRILILFLFFFSSIDTDVSCSPSHHSTSIISLRDSTFLSLHLHSISSFLEKLAERGSVSSFFTSCYPFQQSQRMKSERERKTEDRRAREREEINKESKLNRDSQADYVENRPTFSSLFTSYSFLLGFIYTAEV